MQNCPLLEMKIICSSKAAIWGLSYDTEPAVQGSRADTIANSWDLSLLEKNVIFKRGLDLYEQEFLPALSVVEDMANLLRKMRGAPRVGPCWASSFARRQSEL